MAATPALGALTLDLEPDCGGRVDSFDTLSRVDDVVGLLRTLGVPVTVFVAGRVLEVRPDVVRRLATLPTVEFGLHGYAHDAARTHNGEEIARGLAAFRQFFGAQPAGFRAPHGRIWPGDLAALRQQGVSYDSSIFPTWRPGVFNNLRAPNMPYLDATGLPELPISVFRPIPIPVALGYLRMLGPALARLMLAHASLPRVAVVGFHVHDLVENAHTDRLSALLRVYFRRNVGHGPDLLAHTVATLQQRGYTLVTMSALLASTLLSPRSPA